MKTEIGHIPRLFYLDLLTNNPNYSVRLLEECMPYVIDKKLKRRYHHEVSHRYSNEMIYKEILIAYRFSDRKISEKEERFRGLKIWANRYYIPIKVKVVYRNIYFKYLYHTIMSRIAW